jgi:hypothetical protein
MHKIDPDESYTVDQIKELGVKKLQNITSHKDFGINNGYGVLMQKKGDYL